MGDLPCVVTSACIIVLVSGRSTHTFVRYTHPCMLLLRRVLRDHFPALAFDTVNHIFPLAFNSASAVARRLRRRRWGRTGRQNVLRPSWDAAFVR